MTSYLYVEDDGDPAFNAAANDFNRLRDAVVRLIRECPGAGAKR